MNDFFSVLDDFELEEFVAPEGDSEGVSFSLDVSSDGSVVPEYSEQKLDDVKTDADDVTADDVTKGKNYVWQNATDPFSGSTSTSGVYLSFSSHTDKTNSSGVAYKEVRLGWVTGLSFTKAITTGNGLVIDRTGIGMQATAGVDVSLNSGHVTGGKFGLGTGRFRIGTPGADLTDATVIQTEGFADDAVSFVADDENLQSVTTSGDLEGIVTVTGDYDFTYNNAQVKITGAADDQSYQIYYDDDGRLALDLSTVTAAEDDIPIRVVSAGGAEAIVPPTAETEVRIGTTTYSYANTSNNSEFLVSGTTVKGFVLGGVSDAITVTKSDEIAIYDADDTTSAVTNVSGNNYTITKLRSGYSATITDNSELVIGDTTLEFNITKATRDSGVALTVYFDEDGTVKGVKGLDQFLSSSDTMTVIGANVDSEDGGIPIINSSTTITGGVVPRGSIAGYISVSSGDFTYAGAATGDDTVYVAEGTTVYSVNGSKLLYVGTEGGTVTDGESNVYSYSGQGHFNMTDDEIVSFTFAKAGDEIVLPTENAIPVNYNGTIVRVPTITDSDGAYTLTMTSAGSFTASDLSAGASVGRFTFANEGGTATFLADGTVSAITGYTGSLYLDEDDSGLSINGDIITLNFGDNTAYATATVDTNGVTSISTLADGDTVSSTNSATVFNFTTDNSDGDTYDVFEVNGKVYHVYNDNNGLAITAGGVVTGLDQDAYMQVSEGPVTVNDITYTADEIATANTTGEVIYGFEKKNGEDSSFITDAAHPIFNPTTTPNQIRNWLGVSYGTDQIFFESLGDNLDRSSDTVTAEVYLDGTDPDATATATFNNLGNNLAIVTDDARGTKNIVLGNRGDAVIMMGEDEYSTVNIIGGAGNDTIYVGGRRAEDVVVHEGSMLTNIDLSAGGVDKIHTYAAANANIVLNNYNETLLGGVVVHDPEVPYIKDLTEAIQDGLIVVDGNTVVAIDRDEDSTGVDRKTRITVNNVNSAHQTMIRLFGYKDNKDTYSDDFGQLLGFTSSAGGTLDASDLTEDVVLIGNKDNNKTGGSTLKGTDYDDVIFAGGSDSVDAGKGDNAIILNNNAERASATIVAGAEGTTTVTNLQEGFDGDVIDVTSVNIGDNVALSFEDNVFMVADSTAKSSLRAAVNNGADFVEARLINGSDVLNAAVAKDGGTIVVTGDGTVPDYYVAEDGGISFIGYNDNVVLDVDGDYETSFVGDTNVTLGSSVNSLYGGNGLTYFKGGANDETLVAGIGESSLYGGGGKNVLVGSTGSSKVGSTEFFVIGINNGAQNTISNFEFIENGGANQATFDDLNLGMADGNEVTDIKVSGSDVVLAVKGNESGATERVTIEGAAGKEMLIDRGMQTETVAQIASNVVTVNNSYVDFYAATDDAAGATVKVGNVEATEIWLGGPPIDHDKAVPEFTSSRFTVIDATGSTAQALMAGNELSNTIIGGLGTASMWGGEGNANDLMVAGSGHNEFYYEIGNGNDTIQGANEGDIIHLGATLDQIDFDGTQMGAGAIVVKFTDGGTLNIESGANVTFSFDDGTAVRANRQTGQFE